LTLHVPFTFLFLDDCYPSMQIALHHFSMSSELLFNRIVVVTHEANL